jgi:uncharacterized protein (DUF1499 family)
MLASVLSIGGVIAALIGAVGSGQDWWHFRVGFLYLRYGFFAAIAGAVLALLSMVLTRRTGLKLGARNAVSLVVALGFILFLGNQIWIARSVPAIHDVATNLDDLPQFTRLTVRADNLESVPGEDDPELAGLDAEGRWKALHRRAYGDLQTVRLQTSPAEVLQKAERVARERGWEVAHVDPAAGVLEATDTTFFFRFKDDVVLRARPGPGGGSLVDMRSVSRVGGSDVGVNAKRIRAFLKDLQQG